VISIMPYILSWSTVDEEGGAGRKEYDSWQTGNQKI